MMSLRLKWASLSLLVCWCHSHQLHQLGGVLLWEGKENLAVCWDIVTSCSFGVAGGIYCMWSEYWLSRSIDQSQYQATFAMEYKLRNGVCSTDCHRAVSFLPSCWGTGKVNKGSCHPCKLLPLVTCWNSSLLLYIFLPCLSLLAAVAMERKIIPDTRKPATWGVSCSPWVLLLMSHAEQATGSSRGFIRGWCQIPVEIMGKISTDFSKLWFHS